MTNSIKFLTGKDIPTEERWLFDEKYFENTPSRRDGVTAAKELSYRQQTAGLIQDMGKWIKTKQLVVNTAIVLMQRFYMLHSFKTHDKFVMASAALFLAGKSEEQPRRASDVLKSRYSCLYPDKSPTDVHPEEYRNQIEEILEHEIVLLSALGFDLNLMHPHMYVATHKNLPKDVSVMAYNIVTTTFSLTAFCVKYTPSLIASAAIYIACKWLKQNTHGRDGKVYWNFINAAITESHIKTVMDDFLAIMEQHPKTLQKLQNIRPQKSDQSQSSMQSMPKTGQSNSSIPAKIQIAGQSSTSIPDRQTSDQSQTSVANKIAMFENNRPRSDDNQQPTASKKIKQEQVASSTFTKGNMMKAAKHTDFRSHASSSAKSSYDDITEWQSRENGQKCETTSSQPIDNQNTNITIAKQKSIAEQEKGNTSISQLKHKPGPLGKPVKIRNRHERKAAKKEAAELRKKAKAIKFGPSSANSVESKLIGVIAPYEGGRAHGNGQERPMKMPTDIHHFRDGDTDMNQTIEDHVSEARSTYPSLIVRIRDSIFLENQPKKDLTVRNHHSKNKPISKERKRPWDNMDDSSRSGNVKQSRKMKKCKKEEQ